jgi:hypothetical protein
MKMTPHTVGLLAISTVYAVLAAYVSARDNSVSSGLFVSLETAAVFFMGMFVADLVPIKT